MAAGAAMAVVGWWSGYKLGGVISLFSAETLQNLGFENYWQITFLLLILLVVLMNIGLLFINEEEDFKRADQQKKSQRAIQDKIGSTGLHAKVIAWISETVGGPVVSFFKKNGFNIAIGILGFVFLFKIGEAFLGRMSIVFYKEIGFSKAK